jgi:hypothetical protein
MNNQETQIIIAHYGLNRKILQDECEAALVSKNTLNIFIDFEAGAADLAELYDQPFQNIALAQQRKFNEKLKPVLAEHPTARVAYFGLAPIPVAFHLGYLVGNTHALTIYQWHHTKNAWYAETDAPSPEYQFTINPVTLPSEKQKGKGDVIVRIGTSFSIEPQTTYEVVNNPANEFDIQLQAPHIDSLFTQHNISDVVNAFQDVLNSYANKLTDREQIHLFISSSAGLPFALGTRINTNIYPYVQTYQYDRMQTPKYTDAILITKEVSERITPTEKDKKLARRVRRDWENQLQHKLKPFIKTIAAGSSKNWLETVCETPDEYALISRHLKSPWNKIINIGATSLKHDTINLDVTTIASGFEYVEKTNSWHLDDGFLSGLKKRLGNNSETDLMQAGRLFFFHEALHYSKDGHRLTREIANGIGQFPKVIEEADYQADAWALLCEYRYCLMYEPRKLTNGVKAFFCNAIETAVETMWSFVDNRSELSSIQVRSMNRFLNWYWQWILIEDIAGAGNLEEVVVILLNKPVIEFAGAPMKLRAHRTLFVLNPQHTQNLQVAAFVENRVHRFAPTEINELVAGFRSLNGDLIKQGLKSFQVNV